MYCTSWVQSLFVLFYIVYLHKNKIFFFVLTDYSSTLGVDIYLTP